MGRTLRNRVAATALAGATLTLVAGPAAAVTPTTETSSAHVERPLLDCPDFTVLGVWEISHRLTFFYGSAGVATRDIEQVDFRGRLVNESNGTWVADSGARTYFDTLAPRRLLPDDVSGGSPDEQVRPHRRPDGLPDRRIPGRRRLRAHERRRAVRGAGGVG